MINLRYHIVSLTAVFLALAIGVTLGSTFLDRATVDSLNSQLDSLEHGIDTRDARIGDLERELATSSGVQSALDETGATLLTGALTDVPVLIVTAQGIEDRVLDGLVDSLVVAGARVAGTVTVTDRFALDSDDEVTDLATALGVQPGTLAAEGLRRRTIDLLGGELRVAQVRAPSEPGTDDATAPETTPTTTDLVATDVLSALVTAGFAEWTPVGGGADAVGLEPQTRLVVVGGSAAVPDDLVLGPLVTRLVRGTSRPVATVVTASIPESSEEDEATGALVEAIRSSENQRARVSTVAPVDHFAGWAAAVLALADTADSVVGHYGSIEGSTRLLPARRVS